MQDRDQDIRERAYALWQAEGEAHGRHEDHWDRAARELNAADSPNGGVSTDAEPEADTSDTTPLAPKAKAPRKAAKKTAASPKPRGIKGLASA